MLGGRTQPRQAPHESRATEFTRRRVLQATRGPSDHWCSCETSIAAGTRHWPSATRTERRRSDVATVRPRPWVAERGHRTTAVSHGAPSRITRLHLNVWCPRDVNVPLRAKPYHSVGHTVYARSNVYVRGVRDSHARFLRNPFHDKYPLLAVIPALTVCKTRSFRLGFFFLSEINW